MACLVLLCLGGCSPPRAIEAVEVLTDLVAGTEPSRLKRTTAAPKRVPFPGQPGGDLYWSGDPTAILVLVPGAAPAGRNDPRLVAFAETLARARFLVFVPDIPSLRALRIGPDDAHAIAAAIDRAAACSADDKRSVTVMAISYAAGPAVLAALRPDTSDRVQTVITIGGYYDVDAVVTFFTTGFFRGSPEEPWRHRAPNAYGKWQFALANADRLAAPGDRATLQAIAERKLDQPDAEIDDLIPALEPQGRAVVILLTNQDPELVPALIDDLPPAMRADLRALDLEHADLSRLRASAILVHGEDDPIIPATESEALAAALPDGQSHLYVMGSLAHVEVGIASLPDGFRLWQAVYRILAERDAAPVPDLDHCRRVLGAPLVTP